MGTRIRVQRVGIVHADMRRSIRTYGAKTVPEKTVIDVRPCRDAMRLSDPIASELSGMREKELTKIATELAKLGSMSEASLARRRVLARRQLLLPADLIVAAQYQRSLEVHGQIEALYPRVEQYARRFHSSATTWKDRQGETRSRRVCTGD
jgi:hypothetical protein